MARKSQLKISFITSDDINKDIENLIYKNIALALLDNLEFKNEIGLSENEN